MDKQFKEGDIIFVGERGRGFPPNTVAKIERIDTKINHDHHNIFITVIKKGSNNFPYYRVWVDEYNYYVHKAPEAAQVLYKW